VSEVIVAVDLGAVTNTAAAKHFATLDADLKNALMTRLVDRIGPQGLKIEIDISEVELSNFYQEAANTADTKLVGQVNVSHLTDNTDFASYELAVGVNDVTPLASAETTQTTPAQSTEKYYDAMIGAFADSVVARLGQ
ncbi:MAG: hypothetical protein JNK88_07580, partial [Mangrovicoccus sp.]|nr:hypothetical protein [Mangrovicoccus sp.]